MKKRGWRILILALGFSSWNPVHAQVPPRGEATIVVTAGLIPTPLPETTRTVRVLTRQDIESLPVRTLSDLLAYVLEADFRPRGPMGVQVDLGIRASTFGQILIMVDGVPVADPQTGHHDLNLPIALEDVERVEVLVGPGSSAFGPGAYAGVVHIITRLERKTGGTAQILFGEHRLITTTLAGTLSTGPWTHRVTLDSRRSDGYRPNTDFQIQSVAYRLHRSEPTIHLFAGYLWKRFGANGFYTTLFPNQWERIRVALLIAGWDATWGRWTCQPRAGWRRHWDTYLLDRNRPSWYRNDHVTDVLNLRVPCGLSWSGGQTMVQVDLGWDRIQSNRLGRHHRYRTGLGVEHRVRRKSVHVGLGFSVYRYSDWGWQVWPGIDLAWFVTSTTRVYGSIGRSFRIPTYTELYYESPANLGNPDLRPETAWTVETGVIRHGPVGSLRATLFFRLGRQLIDWVRTGPEQPWRAMNVAHMNTYGVELEGTVRPASVWEGFSVEEVTVGYAYTGATRSAAGFESKYVFQFPRHRWIFRMGHRWGDRLRQYWAIRYEQRVGRSGVWLIDTRLVYRGSRWELALEATNLLDTDYEVIRGIPMPGRWVMVSLTGFL